MVPLAKTGGLGDVCGALPVALSALGCRCSCFLPAYSSVLKSGLDIRPTHHTFTIQIGGKYIASRLLKTRLPGSDVHVYLIDQPQYFDRSGLYADAAGEFRDNCERFAFYCRAVVKAIDLLGLDVDIAHCHDWQAGLVPAYVATNFGGFAWTKKAKSLMTIHNLAYQGSFWHFDFPLTGMDWKYFNYQQMEFYGSLNLMKTGIVFADKVTTVSPTYAREITTAEHGCGLQDILADRGDDLLGIVNGVDYTHWNPASDTHLPATFTPESWEAGKAQCKLALQEEFGLEVSASAPLVGIVSRIADQKGWDLIIPLLEQWTQPEAAPPASQTQWAILGTGDRATENKLRELAQRNPQRLAVKLEFSERVAHRIEAACDMFLMPSRYEPCGLNQLYSLKYGSVPVVHSTGGLADTVIDTTPQTLADGTANGFRFSGYALQRLEDTLTRAVEFYLNDSDRWAQIVRSGMDEDWSWEKSARRYMDVFEAMMQSQTVQ